MIHSADAVQEFLRSVGISLDRAGCLVKQAEVTKLAESQGAAAGCGSILLLTADGSAVDVKS